MAHHPGEDGGPKKVGWANPVHSDTGKQAPGTLSDR